MNRAIHVQLSKELGLPHEQIAAPHRASPQAHGPLQSSLEEDLERHGPGRLPGVRVERRQEEYFRSLNVPNPRFLMQMEEVLQHFLWDWTSFQEQYKVQPPTAGTFA